MNNSEKVDLTVRCIERVAKCYVYGNEVEFDNEGDMRIVKYNCSPFKGIIFNDGSRMGIK